MRSVFVFGIVMMYVIIISHAVPSPTYKQLSLSNEEKEKGKQLAMDLARNFAIRFFKFFTGWKTNDMIISPLSFYIPMWMLSHGTEGETRKNFLSALGLPENRTQLRLIEYGFNRYLDQLADYDVHVKTKIFVASDIDKLNSHFVRSAEQKFNLEISAVDVVDGVMGSVKMNEWVAAQTNNNATEIFEPQHVGQDPSIVLANTVYFKGTWKRAFIGTHTTMRPFCVVDGGWMEVPTMYTVGEFQHGRMENFGAQFIELPYESKLNNSETMSMFIILPDEFENSRWMLLILQILPETLMNMLSNTSKKVVAVFLPKFKIETEVPIKKKFPWFFDKYFPFNLEAGSSNIFKSSQSFNVTEAKSKVVIEVDEEGQRIAGSSEIVYKTAESASFNRKTRSPEWLHFDANHHFIAIVVIKGKIPIFFTHITGSQFVA